MSDQVTIDGATYTLRRIPMREAGGLLARFLGVVGRPLAGPVADWIGELFRAVGPSDSRAAMMAGARSVIMSRLALDGTAQADPEGGEVDPVEVWRALLEGGVDLMAAPGAWDLAVDLLAHVEGPDGKTLDLDTLPSPWTAWRVAFEVCRFNGFFSPLSTFAVPGAGTPAA